jgi:hypothetical protein
VKVREEAQREQREQISAELRLAALLRTELEDQRSDWQQKSDEQSKESWLCLVILVTFPMELPPELGNR